MMGKRILACGLAAVLSVLSTGAQSLPDDLTELDAALKSSKETAGKTIQRIHEAERELSVNASPSIAAYERYGRLYDLSYAFQYNKAMEALDHQESIAKALGDKERTNETLIRKAMLYCTAGYYFESSQTLSRIDTSSVSERLSVPLFLYLRRFYKELYSNEPSAEHNTLISKINYYSAKILELTPQTDFNHSEVLITHLLDNGENEKADSVARAVLKTLPENTHQYAIMAYYLAVASEGQGQIEEQAHWLAKSAIADINSATKDNAALYSLARVLLGKGEVKRAFHYTQAALDDALYYNAKLRPLQIATGFREIEQGYSLERENDARILKTLLYIVGILAIVLLTLLIVTIVYHRRLERAASAISEESAAKEEYLALFLSMSSGYLEKLRHYLSRSEMEDELKNFYSSFDNAFIQLYPTFVEEFNALLVPEERIELKKGELLNTELRIFALIRLGIDQSSHIASLLRYSVNTIYNYRAKTKNAALNGKDSFEEQVRCIGKKNR